MAPSRRSRGHRSRRAFGTNPAHDSAPVATSFRDVPPGLPPTMSLGTTDAWCLKPLHTFDAEGHQSTPSAPKVSAVRDRRGGGGGLFLRNNTHITRVASTLSINHRCTLHHTNRSRMWTEANLLAGRGMTLPKTIFPNKLLPLFHNTYHFDISYISVRRSGCPMFPEWLSYNCMFWSKALYVLRR
jgi:hypothetical protein